ncbi:MAG: GlsB/YeaQ/YmgE family stress response membrane protein [Candidatus Scalindua sp. AMX11]|nr:MAG: GlsB/YeaQ/YmgE family stress response membrane protein [Candidatus Scalindua sp.]NOG83425.1 GlsB/YeaQ/YmgE family stress response membrane protein [Planctomycetota bacterium]RZV75062.1 MAG: GlsB/YeaQ/YmgE family stress response membrane protein [Candidatus Scalindua sp. SCAELEC01]TDE64323.1 MAG: GlsB/YeaQ/YmgE family stress response membrane protein [Candidatus Scalindua sp. AMX11]GJQ60617.1 MAG: membrane protein [Candidatus Scalindua sp.]
MNIILFLAIGAVSGWIAGLIMKGRGFGLIGNLIVGITGAYIGGFLFGLLGLTTYGLLGLLLSALAGAIILLWIISRFKKS